MDQSPPVRWTEITRCYMAGVLLRLCRRISRCRTSTETMPHAAMIGAVHQRCAGRPPRSRESGTAANPRPLQCRVLLGDCSKAPKLTGCIGPARRIRVNIRDSESSSLQTGRSDVARRRMTAAQRASMHLRVGLTRSVREGTAPPHARLPPALTDVLEARAAMVRSVQPTGVRVLGSLAVLRAP